MTVRITAITDKPTLNLIFPDFPCGTCLRRGFLADSHGLCRGYCQSMTAIPAVPSTLPATLGALRASGWQSVPVKEELRRNAVRNIENGQPLFEGVMGYEETVMPQLENALLAGHDVVFLGERGQAKTRMIRSLTGLLDEWMPIIAGSEINDDPYNPVSKHARDLVGSMGDDAPVSWVHRSERFGEKLATPDTSIADLRSEAHV